MHVDWSSLLEGLRHGALLRHLMQVLPNQQQVCDAHATSRSPHAIYQGSHATYQECQYAFVMVTWLVQGWG